MPGSISNFSCFSGTQEILLSLLLCLWAWTHVYLSGIKNSFKGSSMLEIVHHSEGTKNVLSHENAIFIRHTSPCSQYCPAFPSPLRSIKQALKNRIPLLLRDKQGLVGRALAYLASVKPDVPSPVPHKADVHNP